MVTKQQLQNMLDETIEELQKPTSEGGPMGLRFRQLIHHRANLEMRLRDLEKPEPEKIDEYTPYSRGYGKYYDFFSRYAQSARAVRESYEDLEEELFS